LICEDAADGMFVTLFYGLLDPQTGQFTYVNAGHNPPWLCRQGEGLEAGGLMELTRTGMALGVLPDTPYEQRAVHFRPGDFVILYTDGVVDAMGRQGQRFGVERLKHAILEHRRGRAADIVAALEATVGAFSGPSAPFDDTAVLVAKRAAA
jgi:sigma-B regulation protein RsbU (phosphoserine phosphatase)